jgi:hypothetical protein
VGGNFLVRTNNTNLIDFLEQRDINERHQKRVSKVQSYNFHIEYVKGKKNIVVDSLSRRHASFFMTEI